MVGKSYFLSLTMLCGILPLAWGAEASDKPEVVLSATEDFEIRYYRVDQRLTDPSDVPVFDYVEQVNRLNGHLGYGKWSFDIQVDQVALLGNRYYLDDTLYIERQLVSPSAYSPFQGDVYLNPEKIRVSREDGFSTLNLGDYYAAFGRGMALNLNRNVDIDIDTSIQGVKTVFRPGNWDITALIGQLNRQQVFQDNPNSDLEGDRRHAIGAVRIERYGLGPANIGVHGVVYNFVEETGWLPGFEEWGTTPDAVISGANVELLGLGNVDLYVEGNVFHYPTETLRQADEEDTGYGLYASAAIYGKNLVWLVEAKRYFQTEQLNSLVNGELYKVSVPPTLEYERAITEDSAATVNSNDLWGGRVRMDWAARPGELTPYAAFAVYRDLELGGLHFNRVPETVIHPMLGVEWFKGEWAALVNAGYRIDQRDKGLFGEDRQLHCDLSFRFPVAGKVHGELAAAAEDFQWGDNLFQQEDYVELESAVTLGYGSLVSLTWFTDYTTNPLVDSTGNLADAVYGAVELQVKPMSALTVKAFYGSYKAGIRCSGGQCRLLPGFDGARVSLVGSF